MMTRAKRSRELKVLNDPRNTAIHEAGHAVIARVLMLLCGDASVQADYKAGSAGYAAIGDPLESDNEWRRRGKHRSGDAANRARIMSCMAGTEAEAELLGAAQGGDAEDLRHINILAEHFLDCDRNRLLDRLRRMTRMLVRRHRKRIERVAMVLLAKETLTEKQLDKLTGRSIDDVPDLHRVDLQGPAGELITVKVERRLRRADERGAVSGQSAS